MSKWNLDTDKIAADMVAAYGTYGDVVAERVALLANEHRTNANEHRTFTIVKGILSAQMQLDHNIALARFVAHALTSGYDMDSGTLYSIAVAGGLRMGVATGQHLAYIIAQKDVILAMTDEDMTFDNLLTLKGVGPKVAAWIMSLYFGDTDVYTIDRHMLKGFYGTDKNAPTIKQYREIMTAILALHREILGSVPALVGQWALWNMYRDGNHDPHFGIIAAESVV